MEQLRFDFNTGEIEENIEFIPIWNWKKCCKDFDLSYSLLIINDLAKCIHCETILNQRKVKR